MKLGVCAITAVLGASFGASGAASYVGPLEFITDIRRCSASYSGNGSGSSWQDRVVAFDPFQGGADILVTNGQETWSSHCSQDSLMDAGGMSFSASSEATILASTISMPLGAQAQSKFDLWFSIDTPVSYRLRAHVSESEHQDSMATVRLVALNGAVIETVSSSVNLARTVDWTGRLEPGTYRLYAEALGKCRTLPLMVFAHGEATCEMEFEVEAIVEDPEDPPPPVRRRRMGSTDAPPPSSP